MDKVLAVAWRDFKHTALTKAFILGAILVPMILFASIFLMTALFKPNFAPLEGSIALLDETGETLKAMQLELAPERVEERIRDVMERFTEEATSSDGVTAAASMVIPDIRLTLKSFTDPTKVEELKNGVRDGTFKALVVVPREQLTVLDAKAAERAAPVDLFVPSGFAPNHTRLVQSIARDSVVRARVATTGQVYEEVRSLVRAPALEPKRLSKDGGEARESLGAKMLIPMGFMLLLWITTFSSGNQLLTSTIEEKSNKVMEVLLSAVSPMQLITGKILGQAAVSLLMMALYAGLGIGGLTVMAMMDLIPIMHLVYLGIYFVMAYFMVAALMTGVGSAVSDLRDAQSLITPVMLIMFVPWVLWLPISEQPNGLLATVSSFIPPLTPFVMILRVTASSEPVAAWQIVASIVWGFACTIGLIWMAARIFRIGVLMYGKPPTPIELLRWLRYT